MHSSNRSRSAEAGDPGCSRFCVGQSTRKPQRSTGIRGWRSDRSIESTYFGLISLEFHKRLLPLQHCRRFCGGACFPGFPLGSKLVFRWDLLVTSESRNSLWWQRPSGPFSMTKASKERAKSLSRAPHRGTQGFDPRRATVI